MYDAVDHETVLYNVLECASNQNRFKIYSGFTVTVLNISL